MTSGKDTSAPVASAEGRGELAGLPIEMKPDPPPVKVRPQRGSAGSQRDDVISGRGITELGFVQKFHEMAPNYRLMRETPWLQTSPIKRKYNHLCGKISKSITCTEAFL